MCIIEHFFHSSFLNCEDFFFWNLYTYINVGLARMQVHVAITEMVLCHNNLFFKYGGSRSFLAARRFLSPWREPGER